MKNRINRLILVLRHALAMWRALDHPKNRRKGSWREDSPYALLRLLDREVEELWVSVWEFEHGKGTAARVEEEAADVGAFAAMVADRARQQARERKFIQGD